MILEDLGIEPVVRETTRPAPPELQPRDLLVAFARRRLCLDPSFDTAIDHALPASASVPPPDVACIWWPGDRAQPRHQ